MNKATERRFRKVSHNKKTYVCSGKNWERGGSVGWFTVDDIVSVKGPTNCLDSTGEWYFRVSLCGGESFTCRSIECDTSYYDGEFHAVSRKSGEAEIRKVYDQFLKDVGVDIVSE